MFYLHVCLCIMHIQLPKKLAKVIWSSGTRITNGCEPPHGYWESNPRSSRGATSVLGCWASAPALSRLCFKSKFWFKASPLWHMHSLTQFHHCTWERNLCYHWLCLDGSSSSTIYMSKNLWEETGMCLFCVLGSFDHKLNSSSQCLIRLRQREIENKNN